MNATALEQYVLRELAALSGCMASEIRGTDRILKDLKIDSDDFGLDFVERAEAHIGRKLPLKEWETVVTVQDVINLLKRYA